MIKVAEYVITEILGKGTQLASRLACIINFPMHVFKHITDLTKHWLHTK